MEALRQEVVALQRQRDELREAAAEERRGWERLLVRHQVCRCVDARGGLYIALVVYYMQQF